MRALYTRRYDLHSVGSLHYSVLRPPPPAPLGVLMINTRWVIRHSCYAITVVTSPRTRMWGSYSYVYDIGVPYRYMYTIL